MRYKAFWIIVTVFSLFVALLIGCSQEPKTTEPPVTPSVTPPVSVPEPIPEPAPTQVPDNSPVPEPEPLPLTPEQLTMLSISEGDVFIMKSGSVNWEEAEVTTPLEPGDILKTGAYSNAVITFFEGSSIELQASSQVEVVMLDGSDGTGPTTIMLNQEIGKTLSRVKKLTDSASSYEVETPAGVAVVRGSVMLLDVSRSGFTTVTNVEGDIWAVAQGVEVQVPEGRKCNITPGHSPGLERLPDDDDGGPDPKPRPKIAINKTASSELIYSGNEVIYNYTVTNPGDDPLSNIVVTDDQGLTVTFISGDANGNSKLDPGEIWSYTAVANPTANVINIGSVNGTASDGNVVSDNDTAEVNVINPAIAINKTVSPEVIYSGDEVTYDYIITNPGDDPLTGVVVDDDQGLTVTFISGDTNGNSKLDPGEIWSYTATANPTMDIVNTGSASGIDSKGGTVSDDDTAGVNVINPAIAINKTATPEFIYSGNEVIYNYTVTNPGDDPLSNVDVTDDQSLTVTFIDGDINGNSKLDPGEIWSYTATANPTVDIINIGNVTGTDSKDGIVGDSDTAEVTIMPPVEMTVISDTTTVVTYSSSGYASPGDPAELAIVNNDWWTGITYGFPNGAQLIWESEKCQNPVSGDIVDFEKTFIISGAPVSGTLYITCDNGYEAYINGNGYPAGDPNAISAQLGSGWRASDLTESFVNASGWSSVESWDITAYLQSGVNTLEIGTANEQEDGGVAESNTAGLIFEIVISYEAELSD